MKSDIKDFAKVYGTMMIFMLLLAGLEAIGGHASGAAAPLRAPGSRQLPPLCI